MTRRANLSSLLARLRPGDADERAFVALFRELLALPGDVFRRDHFHPGHVTASAFVLSPDGEMLLLIEHSKLHRWLQPGGHVEPEDEDVVAAARREVAEEVGVSDLRQVGEGLFDVDVHEIPARKADPAHRHYDVRILLQSSSWDFVAGSDALAAKWVRLGDVNDVESDASVMRAVGKLL